MIALFSTLVVFAALLLVFPKTQNNATSVPPDVVARTESHPTTTESVQQNVAGSNSEASTIQNKGPNKVSKYSAAPAEGEFQDNQFVELAPDQDRRVVRESRHKNTFDEISDPGDTSASAAEDTVTEIDDYAEPLDPLPVSRSAAVVVGTVVSGKAFVSKDRTYVYSDYQVQVDRVLKQDPSANLSVGSRMVVSRMGGTIHFPSGHIRHFLSHGEGYPRVGSQYLFFLVKPNFPEPEYEMFTGATYELTNGKVHPLDDHQLGRFDEMSESKFMEQVESAISSRGGKS